MFSQSRALVRSYEALLKDRAIIAAEVMHEYDEKVSYPNPPSSLVSRKRLTRYGHSSSTHACTRCARMPA